ncbi:MAG: hypothetical protein WCE75_09880 [Terracidiphilus sp.]
MTRRTFSAALLLVLLSLVTAQACGPEFYPDVFVRDLRPDKPKEFAAGQLGVLLPTYPRADLAVAYRYLSGGSLTAEEQKAYRPSFHEYEPETEGRWKEEEAEATAQAQPAADWTALRARYSGLVAVPAKKEGDAGDAGPLFPWDEGFANCQADAFRTAARTLTARAASWGEKSVELADWLKGQDAVFANCESKSRMLPQPAPESASALLRADRAYQQAAALFYSGKHDEAQQAFAVIGQDAASPWQGIARYLVARSMVRGAFLSGAPENSDPMATFDAAKMTKAGQLLESLLKENPPGVSRHAIQGLLDLVRLRIEPEARLHELASALSGPAPDPEYDQHLKDLTWYLNAKLDDSAVRPDAGACCETHEAEEYSKAYSDLAKLRATAPLVDWLITFQSPAPEAAEHAAAEWKRTHAEPWLLAAIAKAGPKDADVDALLAVAAEAKPSAPAWESLTYHRLRLLAEGGRAGEARALLDPLLPRIKAAGRDSSLNAFLGLRMSTAASLGEFLAYAPRKVLALISEEDSSLGECLRVMKDPKRVYDCTRQLDPAQFSGDAVDLLNRRASLASLAEVSASSQLPEQLRRSVAMMGWVRAVLLKDDAAAARFFPLLPAKVQEQAGAGTGFHALMTLARNPGLRPYLDPGVQRNYSYDFVESYADNWWCGGWEGNFDVPGGATRTEQPAAAFLAPDQQAEGSRQSEELLKRAEAEVDLGGQIVAYVTAHPAEPDAAESLYLVLRLVRYGCNHGRDEGDAQGQIDVVRRQAARLLRQRYAASSWTKKAAPFV